ncbi:hypothetical protein F441_18937 [Phytophthora nicotianae CJ01A1]|uniref:Uncharacterized protein n=2 Tax=Phytophthora nicotianae TaxID=4792 RepID=W2W1H1_PHYNI|nr:hypothetical protein L916_18450 [Phytophthora nicotianae]ETP04241.1 hypothetical protein F441_18937 [Phytophthora nicotianae CJ01A1]
MWLSTKISRRYIENPPVPVWTASCYAPQCHLTLLEFAVGLFRLAEMPALLEERVLLFRWGRGGIGHEPHRKPDNVLLRVADCCPGAPQEIVQGVDLDSPGRTLAVVWQSVYTTFVGREFRR